MKNIYKEIQESLHKYGCKVVIDFKKMSLKLNGKYIIEDGCANANIYDDLGMEPASSLDNFLETVEKLYDRYKHSIPSELSESKKRKYFKALKLNDLSDEDMMFGIGRDIAQFELEYYILVNIFNGAKFYWDDERLKDKWFWQSSVDKDLVLIKDWFVY